MLRRVFNSLLETTLQSQTEAITYPHPFTKPETIPFAWLCNITPCFPVKSTSIRILDEPQQFYQALCDGCASAKQRIYLVSLYLGNGALEKKLVKILLKNEDFRNGNLKINILLDYMRGSRGVENSRTVLQPLLNADDANCQVQVSLYHTPLFRGFLRKIVSNRWKELLGLQHMKLYIFDDTLLISGANLSHDYFTNRQDRYLLINDRRLCDFYCGLVRNVQRFSLQLDRWNAVTLSPEWQLSPYEADKDEFVRRAGDAVERYVLEMRNERNNHKEEGFDTWIFPLIQMGQLGITQDSQTTERLLEEAPKNATLCLATGYFNLTSSYTQKLQKSQAQCQILMAHPKANGFLGAKGLAGGIPYAYSLIARQFEQEFARNNHSKRLSLWEFLRENWTYHGKGLWFYAKGEKYPSLTLIGSPNFGERSVKRDLETQLAIVTENEALRKQLHEEWTRLYRYGLPAETKREVPRWVHAFVYFFRNFF